MGLFERAEIRALSEKLLALAAGQGILLNSAAGRELDEMLGVSAACSRWDAVRAASSPSEAGRF